MRTFQTIIKDGGGPHALARALAPGFDLPLETLQERVKQWAKKDKFIPGEYWPAIARLGWGGATLEELAAIGEAGKAPGLTMVSDPVADAA
jgi:hypothetical protein